MIEHDIEDVMQKYMSTIHKPQTVGTIVENITHENPDIKPSTVEKKITSMWLNGSIEKFNGSGEIVYISSLRKWSQGDQVEKEKVTSPIVEAPKYVNDDLENRIEVLRRMGVNLDEIQNICFHALGDIVNEYKNKILTEELKEINGFEVLPHELKRLKIENQELKERVHEIESEHMIKRFKDDQRTLVKTH